MTLRTASRNHAGLNVTHRFGRKPHALARVEISVAVLRLAVSAFDPIRIRLDVTQVLAFLVEPGARLILTPEDATFAWIASSFAARQKSAAQSEEKEFFHKRLDVDLIFQSGQTGKVLPKLRFRG